MSYSKLAVHLVFIVLISMLSTACENADEEQIKSNDGNNAPTISGNPNETIEYGKPYSFTPVASDPDGDTINFSITNRPSWALFSTTTGTLSGTPSIDNIGTTNNISISVSDGPLSSTLPQFSITVNAAAAANNGTTTLNWLPPTENVDNTEITDLAGYKIYYGTTEGNISERIVVNNPGISSYVVENLPSPSTLFFAVSALDDAGQESPISNIVSKAIQ